MEEREATDWTITTATVSSCNWDEVPPTELLASKGSRRYSRKYRVIFQYLAGAEQLMGEFVSREEWTEGTTFELRFNPDNPGEYSVQQGKESLTAKLLIWGLIAALVIVSLLWRASR